VQDEIAKTVATDLAQNAAHYPKSGKVNSHVRRTSTRVQLQLVNGHEQSTLGQTAYWSRNDIGAQDTQDHNLAAAHDRLQQAGRSATRR
jgi:hypothetical protein